MHSEIKTVGKHTLVYGLGMILGKLASFIMLPIYTRYLSPADYGVLELLGTTVDVIAMIAGIGLAAGVFKFYAEADSDPKKREVISTAMLGSMGLAFLASALGFAFADPLAHLVFGSAGDPLYFRLIFVTYFLQAAGGVPLMLIRAQDRSVLFVVLNALKLVGMLSLNIYFVVFQGAGVRGVLMSGVMVTGVYALFLSAYAFRHVGVSFSGAMFQRMSRFGAPLIVWSLGSFILTFSDRYFLNYYLDPAAVGVYSLAYKFSFLLSAFAVAPFSQAWEPRRFAVARQADAGEVYRKMFSYLNTVMIGGAIGIVLFVDDVLRIMVDPAFLPAAELVPLILVTTVLQQWASFCNLGLYLKNATHLYAWSAVIGVVTALTLNALLIPTYGMFGAAWATIGAYAIRFVAVYIFSQARYPIQYAWGKIALLAGLFTAAWGARHLVGAMPLTLSLATSMLLFGLTGLTVYRHLLSVEERSSLRSLVLRRLPPRLARAV